MKTKFILLLGCLALASSVTQAAQLGTAISYQGRLTDGGNPANGTHSFKYRLVADAAGATQIGSVVDLPNQNVSGGLFNASLDFGVGAFNGQERWLEISVKTGGPGAAGDYIKLNPQPLPPAPSSQFARISGDVLDGAITGPRIAPLAITSGNLADGAVTAAKLGAGSVGSSQIADGSILAADIGNNQVVKSVTVNGSGNLRDSVNLVAGQNIALSPSGNTVTISSSGTSGSIWTAPGGGNIYYNGGRVGIGTTTPAAFLDILGSWDGEQGALNLRGNRPTLRFTGDAANNGDQSWLIHLSGNGPGNLEFFRRTGPVSWANVMSLTPQGNVGIGTTAPRYPLQVSNANNNAIYGESDTGAAVFGVSSSDIAAMVAVNLGRGAALYGENKGSGAGVYGETRGGGTAVFGKSVTGEAVHGESSSEIAAMVAVNFGQGAGLYGENKGPGTGVFGESRGQGIGVFGKSATGGGVHGETSGNFAAVAGINLAGGAGVYGESRGGGYAGNFAGKTRVCTLEIYGGCDLAEPFPMKEEQIDKGSVVVIDEEHPGRLKLSTRAYDTQVAGIISGANGINPGISLTQEGALDQGQNVALTGRVYVKADASRGAIKPGDLLTTSDTPGHAMKVSDHIKSQGTILGKAMSALKESTGLVLVLVTLQ